MSKSEKLYKDSPTIKKDKDGKSKVERPSAASMDDMGLSGPSGAEGAMQDMPITVKQSIAEIHSRHEQELKDMHKRHLTEMKDFGSKLGGDSEGSAEDTSSKE